MNKVAQFREALAALRVLRLRKDASDDEDITAQEQIEVLFDAMTEEERVEARLACADGRW